MPPGRKKKKKDVIVKEEFVENVGDLTCSSCHMKFTKEKEASKHILTEHYNLARINDSTPFTDGEIVKALMQAQKALKTLKCKRDGCGKSFKSGLGLKYHLESCGKSEEEVTTNCKVCGKRLKTISMNLHMKIHTPVSTNEKVTNVNNNHGSGKRASAIKAREFIKRSTTKELIISGNLSDAEYSSSEQSSVEDDAVDSEHDENDNDCNQEDVGIKMSQSKDKKRKNPKTNTSIVKVNVLDNITNSLKTFINDPRDNLRKFEIADDWSLQLETKGYILCPVEGCSHKCNSKTAYTYHHAHCGISNLWGCSVCKSEFRGQKVLIKHIVDDHKEVISLVPNELQDDLAAICSSIKSTNQTSIRERPIVKVNTINSIFNLHERNYKEKVFPDWIPTLESWIQLREKEHEKYKPLHGQSPSFKIKTYPDMTKPWQKLNLFESTSSPDHITFYTGGPISSSAWVPIPVNINKFSQYLAIATCLNFETTHRLDDVEPESGIIQLWNCGFLERKFCTGQDEKPQLALCLAHDYGVIWDMEWCPGGVAWDDVLINDTHSEPNSQTQSSILSRLGLLALACGDGDIRIHSIPHPKSLTSSSDTTFPLYSNKPIAILSQSHFNNSSVYSQTICKCLSWLKSNGQHLIAGGYGSGLVSIWDLISRSNLLVISQDFDQIILRPKINWSAHSASVSSIKWFFNSSKNVLATCSLDRSAKIWDLKDLAIPVTTIKKGLFTKIETHPQWCGLFMANDDCYLSLSNPTSFKDSGYINYHTNNMTAHKSTVWDISFSEWLNSLVSVDAGGEAVIYSNFHHKPESKSRAGRNPDHKYPLYHLNLECLSQNIPSSEQVNSVDANQHPYRSFNDICDKFGLVFNDFPLNDYKSFPNEERERIKTAPNMQSQKLSDYPLVSIKKATWNCNYSSFTWVFTAGQSGICRLSCVSFLGPQII